MNIKSAQKITIPALILLSVIASSLIFFLCTKDKTSSHIETSVPPLPPALMYNGAPLSNACLYKLLSTDLMGAVYSIIYIDYADTIDIETSITETADEPFEGEFEWSYIGHLPQGDVVVHAYLWPKEAMGKFSGHFVLRRTGNSLQIIDVIADPIARHSTMIRQGTLEGTKLTYSQGMTRGTFFYQMIDLFPELAALARNKSREELYFGEADYFGTADFEVMIALEGTMQSPQWVSFSLAEGLGGFVDKELQPSSLTMGESLLLCSPYSGKLTLPQMKEMMIEVIKYAKAGPDDPL